MVDFLSLISFANPYMVIASGLLLGLIHSFEPDHLTAVSTQMLKSNSKSKTIWKRLNLHSSVRGMFWGMGHTTSIVLVGVLIAGMSISISSTFFLGTEMIVGFMLIGLGIFALINRKFSLHQHIHPHKHGKITHTHPHTHDQTHQHNHKSYIIGCIHGLAGSGGIVVLAVSSLGTFELTMSFLVLFGVGSIVGMTVASGLLGIPFSLITKLTKTTTYLRYGVASIAIGIGAWLVYEIGNSLNGLL